MNSKLTYTVATLTFLLILTSVSGCVSKRETQEQANRFEIGLLKDAKVHVCAKVRSKGEDWRDLSIPKSIQILDIVCLLPKTEKDPYSFTNGVREDADVDIIMELELELETRTVKFEILEFSSAIEVSIKGLVSETYYFPTQDDLNQLLAIVER